MKRDLGNKRSLHVLSCSMDFVSGSWTAFFIVEDELLKMERQSSFTFDVGVFHGGNTPPHEVVNELVNRIQEGKLTAK